MLLLSKRLTAPALRLGFPPPGPPRPPTDGEEKTMSEVADRCRKVIAGLLKVPVERVTPQAHFVRDLGMESVQAIELIAALEEEFDISIDEEKAQGNDTVAKA